MLPLATIVVVARNAAGTIQRAARSAVAQGDHPILLVDDHSSDDTAALARATAGTRLTVVSPPEHRTLGFTRQTGLLAIATPYAVWLDADDELLPGRVDRLVAALEKQGAAVTSDGVELMDGESGRLIRVAPIPSFLRSAPIPVRLFERNVLPGPGVVGMRTDAARRIGYDVELDGAEDVDFLLRAVASGARFALLSEIGYRAFNYPGSHSRQMEQQRRMYRAALAKHSYESVRLLYEKAGHDARITAWGLAAMATFREDYARALQFVDEAWAMSRDGAETLEPDGPWPFPEAWRAAFHRGTLLLLLDRPADAAACLHDAEEVRPSAEGANNLGVAIARLGGHATARSCFHVALSRFPDLLDARLNLAAAMPDRVTALPLRTQPARRDYQDLAIWRSGDRAIGRSGDGRR